MNKFKMQGWFDFVCRNPDGSIAWEERVVLNGTTTAGLNSILDVMFRSATQLTTWYIGLIDNSGFSALSPADTMASHAGWTESTAYGEATRPAWAADAPASGIITADPLDFTISGTVTIKGAFLCTVATKGDSSGTLWATGAFASPQSMTAAQVLSVRYTCTATGS